MEGETKRKETEEEMEETSKANTIEQRIGDESIIKEMNQTKVVQGHVEDEHLWKLQKCLVGKVANFCEIKSLADKIARMGLAKLV